MRRSTGLRETRGPEWSPAVLGHRPLLLHTNCLAPGSFSVGFEIPAMSTHETGVDRMLDALRHPRRRRLLAALRDEDRSERMDLDEFTGAVAADDDEERVRLSLFHSHLPKLEACGYVSWDREAGTVVRGPDWAAVQPLLETAIDVRTESLDRSCGPPDA